jgi:hypothetical protein
MGFIDWDGPVRLTQLAEGVILISRAYEEAPEISLRVPAGPDAESPTEPTEGGPDAA